MKTYFVGMIAIAALVAGCASSPTVVQNTVGPDPYLPQQSGPDGYLQVFTATREHNTVGEEFPYSQRTDYLIYDWKGKEVEHVFDNNHGKYESIPRTIQLPPGTYRVKALAAPGYGKWVTLGAVVEASRTTDIHLNGHWAPPAEARDSDLVHSPSGYAIGFKAAMPPS